MFGKNQLMIAALAVMIAVAGYLNFADDKVSDEDLVSVTGTSVVEDTMQNYGSDLQTVWDGQTTQTDDYQVITENTEDIFSLDSEAEGSYVSGEEAFGYTEEETPGEAIYTSSANVSALSGARLQKEQMRAQNKAALMEIINNANVAESQKQQAIDHVIRMTDVHEKETAAEILLEAKGFDDAIVNIEDTNVDVVVDKTSLSENERAQIEDIVIRKTGASPEHIVISTLAEQ